MKPIVLPSFLETNDFRYVREVVEQEMFARTPEHFDPICGRWYALGKSTLRQIHDDLIPVVSRLLGFPVKTTYSLIVMYGRHGVLPPHVDREPCQYTVDLCVSQNDHWPLYIDDREFLLGENEAVLYTGTTSNHYRHPLISGYCNMALFHFAPLDYEGPLD